MNNKFDYEEYVSEIEKIKKKYPFLVCHSVGESVCKRKIYGLSVGNYKSKVLFFGGLSGRDVVAMKVLLKYISNVSRAFQNKTKIAGVNVSAALLTRGLTVIPCVNPDGLEIVSNGKDGAKEYGDFVQTISKGNFVCWDANVKGIDISRNFNSAREEIQLNEAQKGIFGPSASGYGGFAAESEPETAAVVNFCERNNVHHAFVLQGNKRNIKWQGENSNPENSRTMVKILSVCSGYGIVNDRNEEDLGGFKDWFCENFHKSAFSLGVTRDESKVEQEYKSLEEMLVIGTII